MPGETDGGVHPTGISLSPILGVVKRRVLPPLSSLGVEVGFCFIRVVLAAVIVGLRAPGQLSNSDRSVIGPNASTGRSRRETSCRFAGVIYGVKRRYGSVPIPSRSSEEVRGGGVEVGGREALELRTQITAFHHSLSAALYPDPGASIRKPAAVQLITTCEK